MFNQHSTSPSQQEKSFIPVIITLIDGETIKGTISMNKGGRLGDLLNGTDRYVLFKTNSGEPLYLSMRTIAAVQSNEKPSARQLDQSLKQLKDVNPYAILQVEPGIDKEQLRNKYHTLVKNYHTDQFSSVPLPKEVLAYLETVIQRLNAAYQEIIDDIDRLEQAKQMQAVSATRSDTGTIRYFGQ